MSKITSKEKLIEATIDCVWKNGLHSVTTAKIAKVAGLSEAMIYKHFGNKDDLVVESYLWLKKSLYQYVAGQMDPNQEILEQSRTIWFSQFNFFVETPAYLSMLTQIEHSNYLTSDLRSKGEILVEPLFDLYDHGVKQGIFKPLDREVVVALFLPPILTLAEAIINGRMKHDPLMLEQAYECTIKGIRQ